MADTCPSIEEAIPIKALNMSIVFNLSVRRKAVEAGTISIAITMILPTASNAATVVIATMVMSK